MGVRHQPKCLVLSSITSKLVCSIPQIPLYENPNCLYNVTAVKHSLGSWQEAQQIRSELAQNLSSSVLWSSRAPLARVIRIVIGSG